MKNKKYYAGIILILSIILAACSTTQQTTKEAEQKSQPAPKKDSLYVFDQVPTVPPKDTTKEEIQNNMEPESLGATFYLVQIGAFTTKEAADEFAAKSRTKINEGIKVSFNSTINLYVVQVAQHYSSHEDAETERNILWKIPEFKDAWIVTEQK